MRVGEVAALRIDDVRNADGSVKAEIRLGATQMLRGHGMTAWYRGRHTDRLAAFPAYHLLYERVRAILGGAQEEVSKP